MQMRAVVLIPLFLLAWSCGSSPTPPLPSVPVDSICDVPPAGPPSSIHSPSWSTDGTRIAFHSAWDSLGNLVFGWYETDTLGSFKKPMGIDGATMRWMPGDSQIVTNAGSDFLLFNLNSKQSTLLGLNARQVIFDVSLSGKYLYFTQVIPDSGDTTGIYRYDFLTQQEEMVIGGFALAPRISSGDSLLAFVRPGPILYTINLLSGEEKLVNTGLPPEDDVIIQKQWIDANKTLLVHTLSRKIGAVSLDSGFQFLTCGLGWVSLSSVDSSILHIWSDSIHGYQIWRVNRDGTDKCRVTFFR
jgi:hypothetical protein